MRLERGLFRQVRNGQIYSIRRIGGKVRWTRLGTADLRTARTMASNGDFDLPPLPDLAARHAPAVTWNRQDKLAEMIPGVTGRLEVAHEGKKTLGRAWESWQKTWVCAKGTADTREYRWRMLGTALGPETPLDEMSLPRLRELQGDLLRADRAPATVNDLIGKLVRPIIRHAVEQGWLLVNPCDDLKPVRSRDPVREQPTWEQALQIIREAKRSVPETGLMLEFMLSTGCGPGEIKGLRGEHVEHDTILFVRQKTGKGYSVPVFEHLEPTIRTLRHRIQPGKRVFNWRDPRAALKTACAKLEMPVYGVRALRRTFTIHCLESGCDPRAVAGWLGHRDARLVLAVYGRYVNKAHERSQAMKLNHRNRFPPADRQA